MTEKSPQNKEPEDIQAESVESDEAEKIREKFSKHAKKGVLDDIYVYVQENMRDTIAYLILVIGLILLFFLPFWGELLIGIVAGFYFSDELISWTKRWEQIVHQQGVVKSIVCSATLLALLIMAPMIFVGAGVVAGLKYLFLSEKKK